MSAAPPDVYASPKGPRLGDHRRVHDGEDLVQFHLLDVFGGVDAEPGDAHAGEGDQVAGDLPPH